MALLIFALEPPAVVEDGEDFLKNVLSFVSKFAKIVVKVAKHEDRGSSSKQV